MIVVEPPFTGIDHVQLAMPEDGEEAARIFYSELLGMREIAKPPDLAKRGGCWFESGIVQLHLGIEKDFRPAKKAHPALTCGDYEGLILKLRSAGFQVNEVDDIPGVRRGYVHDPFGNRIELMDGDSSIS